MEYLDQIEFWHWWVATVALIVIEALAPGAIFMWLGVSAAVVGAVLLLAPDLSWEYQVLIFAVLSVATVVGWRIYHKSHPTETDLPTLNRRGEQYIGRKLTLDEAIVNKLVTDTGETLIEGGYIKTKFLNVDEITAKEIISKVNASNGRPTFAFREDGSFELNASSSDGRVEQNGDGIKVYDGSGQIRIKLGKL